MTHTTRRQSFWLFVLALCGWWATPTAAIDLIITGAGSGGHVIKEETTTLPQRSFLTFLGTGATCADNAGADATECTVSGVSSGLADPGANGLVNRTSAGVTSAVTSSLTVGQTLRVTGANAYAWGALNLADPDAVTGLLPDANLTTNIARLDTQNVWTEVRQIFNPSGVVAGINVGAHAGNPSTPVNGDLWYNSTTNALMGRINGANVALGAGAGGGNVSNSGTPTTGQIARWVNATTIEGVTTIPLATITEVANVLTNTSTHIVTNKDIVARSNAVPVVSNGITLNCDTTDIGTVNAITADLTVHAPTCTGSNPRDGQDITFRFFSATPRFLTWNAIFAADNGLNLPLVTTGNNTTYDHVKFRWNAATGTWGLLSLTQGMTRGIATLTSSTTYSCNTSLYRQCEMQMTGATGTITFAAPPGTPANGDRLRLLLMTTNQQNLAWNAIFIASAGVPLPAISPASLTTWTVVEVQYSSVLTKWQAVANSALLAANTAFKELLVADVSLPVVDPAVLDGNESALRLLFDDTTSECAFWQFTMPGDYVGTLSLRMLYTMTTAAGGGISLNVQLAAITPGDAIDVEDKPWGTVNNCDTSPVPATPGFLGALVCPLTNTDNVAANDMTFLRVCRATTDLADTAAEDLEALTFLLSYAK